MSIEKISKTNRLNNSFKRSLQNYKDASDEKNKSEQTFEEILRVELERKYSSGNTFNQTTVENDR